MHMKTLFLSLILVAGQAHAGFMFCESKLKKIGLKKEEAEFACASPYIDSTKKMLETEDPKEMAKVIRLMSSSVESNLNFYTMEYRVYYRISDPKIALKVVKRLPDDALETFYLLVEEFGINDAEKMASLLPPEKIKYANKIAKGHEGNQASFYNLINTTTTDQLATYTILLEKFSNTRAASLLSKYTKKDIECGLSFTDVSSSKKDKYENYISLCNQYHTGKLCSSKAMLFATALKESTSNTGPWLMDQLMNSDHYTKNHALIFDKINSSKFFSEMYDTTDKLLKSDVISDQLTNKVLKEFENPFVTSSIIEDLIKPTLLNTTISGRTFEKSGKVTANWGNGSSRACSSDKGQAAMAQVIKETQSECMKYYEGKNNLKCDTEVVRNKSEGICSFMVTTKSTYEPDKTPTKSCYDQDLQDGLTAVNKINKAEKEDDASFINTTTLQKEAQTVPRTNTETKSTKTSDR